MLTAQTSSLRFGAALVRAVGFLVLVSGGLFLAGPAGASTPVEAGGPVERLAGPGICKRPAADLGRVGARGVVPAGCGEPGASADAPDGRATAMATVGRGVYVAGLGLAGVQRVHADGRLAMVTELSGLRTCGPSACRRDRPGGDEPTDYGAVSIAVGPGPALYMLDGVTGAVRAANLGWVTVVVNGVRLAPGDVRAVASVAPIEEPGWQGQGLAVDAGGRLFAIDGGRVQMTSRSGAVSTVVTPSRGEIGTPRTLAVDAAGNLLVGDEDRVLLLNRGAEAIERYGVRVAPDGLVALPGTGVKPTALAVDPAGNVYLASPSQHAVRRLSPDGRSAWVAGTGQEGFNGDGRPGRVTMLSSPTGLAVDAAGNLVIADAGNDRIRRMSLATPTEEPAHQGAAPGALALGGIALVGLLAVAGRRPRSAGRRRAVATGVVASVLGSGALMAIADRPGGEIVEWASAATRSQSAAAMAVERVLHTSTLLDPPACHGPSPAEGYPCGQVLVVGGTLQASPGHEASPVERFDPVTGRWQFLGPMPVERFAHTATLLADGRVLVAGGETGFEIGAADPRGMVGTDQAFLYDPRTDAWAPTTTPMRQGRFFHTAILLDPPVCRQGLSGPPERGPQGEATGRPRWCGNVLVAGGSDRQRYRPSLASAELFDPASGSWSEVGSMATARQNHVAALLPDGRVLAAAGVGQFTGPTPDVAAEQAGDRQSLASAEVFDPATGSWSPAAPMEAPRAYASATVLDSADCRVPRRPPEWCGRVLVAGGYLDGGTEETLQFGEATATVEVFDPTVVGEGGRLGAWRQSRSMGKARQGHAAALLPDGRVLVAGGEDDLTAAVPSGTSEVYDIAAGEWRAAGPLDAEMINATATGLGGPRCRVEMARRPPWCGGALVAGGIIHLRRGFAVEGRTLATTQLLLPPRQRPRSPPDLPPPDLSPITAPGIPTIPIVPSAPP